MRSAKWLNSLGAKVMLAYVAGLCLSMALIFGGIAAISTWQGTFAGADIAATAKDVSGELRFGADGMPTHFDTDDDDFHFEWIFVSLQGEAAWRVLDAEGDTVLVSAAGDPFWPRTGPARQLGRSHYDFEKDGIVIHAATEPVVHEGRTWYFQVAASNRFLNLVYHAFALPFTSVGILVFALILLITFAGCGYAMLRYTLRPVRAISQSAASISPRSLDARLQTAGVPNEIAPLVDSFNRVLERLEHGYQVQREFLATAAHELKTPLALIRAQIELQPPGTERGSLLNDVQHMTRQVQQLLLLAEASEAQSYRFAEVDVREVAQEAADYLQRMASAAQVDLHVTATDAVASRWQADRGALFTLFKNMLENAIQHAPPGSAVCVEVTATEITVRDHGPGVTAEQLTQMFDRFWRGAHRRDHGAGLGLAICQEIALAHGWQLSAQQAAPGLRLCLTRLSTD